VRKLLIATHNPGKIREYQTLLADLPLTVTSLQAEGIDHDVEETGTTFTENAVIKAQSYAAQTGFWSLADDSGLEVEALGNAPGIFSARYAGENATDLEKIIKLLYELEKTSDPKRLARFVCAMAISDEKGEIKFLTEGVCNGRIALSPSGAGGFGYDPIFVPDGFEQTFGELSDEIKQKISHRARAAQNIIAFLRGFYVASLDQQVFRL
jgi:XTP/dITP diphosphohydrolase